MELSKEYLGTAEALSAGIIWGFLGIFVRGCSEIGLTPMQMTCLRYLIVTIIMFFYVWRRKLFSCDRESVILFVVMGVVGLIMNSTFYFQSMLMIPLSVSTVLQYLSPFIVLVLSVPLFGEKIGGRKTLAVIIAFAGCVLCTNIFSESGSISTLGVIYGAASGFFYAVYILCSKKLADKGCPTPVILFYTAMICFAGLVPVCGFGDAVSAMVSSPENLLLIIALGIFLTLLPFALFNHSLEFIEAGKASIISFAEPLTATAVGLLLYGEEITIETAAGMAVLFLALVIISRKQKPDASA